MTAVENSFTDLFAGFVDVIVELPCPASDDVHLISNVVAGDPIQQQELLSFLCERD
ncbi:hypothetical protein [Natrarchaeobaculum sulfurireducens]|uniref:hypothetical protein n=1 Tax=Natrarchaeobaculum sulfurireducens TaxID=2044521 RepID=UPI00137B5CA3|nr:hypothetical protein [Natrarchaeobaculum sulfurireducens]